MHALAVNVVNHIKMVCQPLGNLRIGHAPPLIFFQSELRLHLRIDVFDTDDDMLSVP